MTRNVALTAEILASVATTETRKQSRREEKRRRRLRTQAKEVPEEGPIPATPERGQHDPLERLDRAPFDDRGPDSRPMRVKDRWIRMEENGSIDAAMRRAAHRFRRDFALAGIETLRASPLLRLPRTGVAPDPTERRLDARQATWAALDVLGGASAPSGSIVWHCVGRDETVKDWAIRQSWAGHAPLNEAAAKGILLAALWTLADHYRRIDKAERVRCSL